MIETFALICTLLLVAGVLAFIAFALLDGWHERAADEQEQHPADDEPPTEAFPVVELTWEEKRARFAAILSNVRAAYTPTAEYRVVVERNFGVRVTDVGPREISGMRSVGWATAEQAVAHG